MIRGLEWVVTHAKSSTGAKERIKNSWITDYFPVNISDVTRIH
jgi:hypothetical protein